MWQKIDEKWHAPLRYLERRRRGPLLHDGRHVAGHLGDVAGRRRDGLLPGPLVQDVLDPRLDLDFSGSRCAGVDRRAEKIPSLRSQI